MPGASCCFLLVFYIAGNQYQAESKCNKTFCGIFMDQKTPNGPEMHLGVPRGVQPTRARLGPHARPGGLCSPRGTPLVLLWPILCLLIQKKISKHFRCIWTLFGIDFLRSKKEAKKTTTSTGHYINRLVPKNYIKLL